MRIRNALLLSSAAFIVSCGRGSSTPPPQESVPETPASASEGKSGLEAKESTNRPPVVTLVTITPTEPTIRTEIVAKADGQDAESTNVDFTYQWYINGEARPEQVTDTLPAGLAVHNDIVFVEVIPHDDMQEGEAKRSAEVKVRNLPPEFGSKPPPLTSLDGFRFEVMDPDGDPLTFTLNDAPSGMTIDSTGVLHWSPDPNEKGGSYQTKMVVRDPLGGSLSITIPVSVSAAVPPGKVEKQGADASPGKAK